MSMNFKPFSVHGGVCKGDHRGREAAIKSQVPDPARFAPEVRLPRHQVKELNTRDSRFRRDATR